ncbi:MAG: hypothetical protein LBG44_09110 [Gemmatimonadota bacterium]|nr:hypothetical protein [Gemmatimonadota bacterium]
MNTRKQPQRLPPPIIHGSEVIDAEIILHEFPDTLGLALWKTVRSVRLWLEVGEGERATIFGKGAFAERIELLEAAGLPPELETAMLKTAAVLRKRARASTVGAACHTISEWAEARGAYGTAIEFLQVVALALPADATLANEVGRVARTKGEYQRAETWFRLAIARARRAQNKYEFTRSYIDLGNVSILRESFSQGKRALIRGLRAGRRFSLHPMISAAYQELAILSVRLGNATDVHRYTRAAVDSSIQGNPGLPVLAFEYGVFLLNAGYFPEALKTIVGIPEERVHPSLRQRWATTTAYTAAAVKNPAVYEGARELAQGLLESRPSISGWIELARAAVLANDFPGGKAAVRKAQQLVAGTENPRAEQEIASLLRITEAGLRVEPVTEARKCPPRVRELVEDLEMAVRASQAALPS